MTKMRAVQLFAPGDLRCVEVDRPEIENENEVIVKVKACGVCGSDLMRVMVKGAYRHPITIGHEFSGTVEATGSLAERPESRGQGHSNATCTLWQMRLLQDRPACPLQ